MSNFAELGMSFELFLAPVKDAILDASGLCDRCMNLSTLRFSGHCYDCFRQGFGSDSVDTELGLVLTELVDAGMTHGIPTNDPSNFDEYGTTPHSIDPRHPDHRWYHVHVNPVFLRELLRTPKYLTWQGEIWLFCCKRPMAFLGSVPGGLIDPLYPHIEIGIRQFIEDPRREILAQKDYGPHTYYAFSCITCGRLRYHDDCD
jgi:hypothetical protein